MWFASLSLSLSPISILPISVSFLSRILSQTSNNFDHRYFKVSCYLFRFYLVEWANYLIWQWFISIGEKMRERFVRFSSYFPSSVLFFLPFSSYFLFFFFFSSSILIPDNNRDLIEATVRLDVANRNRRRRRRRRRWWIRGFELEQGR